MTGVVPAPARLLTFAPMIDSEATRLLCAWYGIDYAEADHLFGWASALTILHGGYGRVPLLHGDALALSGPRRVVDRFDPLVDPAHQLVPAGARRAGIDADWTAYNGSFAQDVAVFSYFHLLPERALMTPIFAGPVPAREARLTPMAYPLLRWLFTTLLQLTPAQAEAAGTRIRIVFAALDRRVADGRRYLCGERLTLGDIAFASAAAPLLQPMGYGTRMPVIADMPAPMRDLIEDLRQCPAAAYVLRVYRAVKN